MDYPVHENMVNPIFECGHFMFVYVEGDSLKILVAVSHVFRCHDPIVLHFTLLYQPQPNCRTIKFMNWGFHFSLEVTPLKFYGSYYSFMVSSFHTCSDRTWIFALWPLSSKFSITFTHGNTFAKSPGLFFFIKNRQIKVILVSPQKCPLSVSEQKMSLLYGVYLFTIHGYYLLYIILSTNFEVAAHIIGATDLAQCEIMNCCDLLNSCWVSNLHNCDFF